VSSTDLRESVAQKKPPGTKVMNLFTGEATLQTFRDTGRLTV